MSPNTITSFLCGGVALAAMVVASRVVDQADTLAALETRARAGRHAHASTCSTIANLLEARRWPEDDATLFDVADLCIWRPDLHDASRINRERAHRDRVAVVGRIRASVLSGRYYFDRGHASLREEGAR